VGPPKGHYIDDPPPAASVDPRSRPTLFNEELPVKLL
jgi:hypothetical protein